MLCLKYIERLDIMKRNFYYSAISFVLFVMLMTTSAFSQQSSKDANPLLNSQILPGFHLIRNEREVYKWDELSESAKKYFEARGVELKKIKRGKSVRCFESWCSLTREELNKAKKKKPDYKSKPVKGPGYTILNITGIYAESEEAAVEWLKCRLIELPWSEGSFSGKKIGDACWSNKTYLEKHKDSPPALIFRKGKTIISIAFGAYRGETTEFVEKLAEFVISKL